MGERPRSMEEDEDFWGKMRSHFSDGEIVSLAFAISSWIALGRFAHTLELDQICLSPRHPPSSPSSRPA
jgi:hypothetical protein